ncbi:hypothetical protein [Roseibium sp. MMSF_3412]|uniref:hypothetical protein n=1 Tax=Roseibium sp. MMSF_3412 TaxID=3046712 RepID=UPI00273F5A2C|nr:hypothetical protein [Roseibium sp. MMSF_3412]
MARFPHYKSNAAKLGKLLAHAATDASVNKAFKQDPASFLREIGLPPETTELFNFKVVSENSSTKSVTLPYRLNAAKLANEDAEYLGGLSQLFPQRHLN